MQFSQLLTVSAYFSVKTKENMIIDWINRKRAAIKRAKEAKRAALFQETKRAIDEFRTKYFADITFPIVILTKDYFTPVSDLMEYYYDIDIHRWGIESSSELVDSVGNKYNFKDSEKSPSLFVPNEKTGTMECEELKTRLAPMLYMPKHREIDTKKSIREIIELLYPE
jgi:hypothetical protein